MGDLLNFVIPTPKPTVAPANPGTPSVSRVRAKPFCGHTAILVDENSREVSCQKCEAPLDPVAALVTLCWSSGDFVARLEAMKKERESLSAEIEELKKLRASLKQAVRRASK